MAVLERIDRALARFEAVVVIIDLFILLGLSLLQLILRKLFDFGFEWADIIARQMVLWIGFMGGALATYEGRHIAIDIVSKTMSKRVGSIIRVITSLAALGITLLLARASIEFVELEMDTELVSGIPAWPFKAVAPLALGLISFHFFVWTVRSIQIALGKEPPPRGDSEAQAGAI